MQIREYIDTDWPSVWPIFREVVAAGDTLAYDPGWSSEQAQRVWVEAPPGLTFDIIGTVPEAFEHPTLGRVGLHVMHRHL